MKNLDSLIARSRAVGEEDGRIEILMSEVIDDDSLIPQISDPFSDRYRDEVISIHQRISGRAGYSPDRDERIDLRGSDLAKRPSIYMRGSSKHLGQHLEAIGFILQTLDARSEHKILEYGPGDGQIVTPLARMGCDATVVDIESNYLEAIRLQAEMYGATIRTLRQEFTADVPGGPFDRIVFYEAFHHAVDHARVLSNAYSLLRDDGMIVLAGEPIVTPGSTWWHTVPAPWCFRMDGLSLAAVRENGWMELGFQEPYFIEMAMRVGFLVTRRSSPSNALANCYVLRKRDARGLAFSEPFLMPLAQEWHRPEATGRWSSGSTTIPLALTDVGRTCTVNLFNYYPESRPTFMSAGGDPVFFDQLPFKRSRSEVVIREPRLVIKTLPLLASAIAAPDDTRRLGFFIESIEIT